MILNGETSFCNWLNTWSALPPLILLIRCAEMMGYVSSDIFRSSITRMESGGDLIFEIQPNS
jgi:hypothetical protein